MKPETRRKLLGFLGALPVAFWCVLVGAVGLLLAFLRGKALGRQDEKLSRQEDEAIERLKRLNALQPGRDDAEAQRQVFGGIKGRP